MSTDSNPEPTPADLSPPLTWRSADIAHELKTHSGSTRLVLTPSGAIVMTVVFFPVALGGLALIGLAAWIQWEAHRRSMPIEEKTVGLMLFCVFAGMQANMLAAPMIRREPRWSIDSRAKGILALVGPLSTLQYLACAYHAVQTAETVHASTGRIARWKRKWVAEYLRRPYCVTLAHGDPSWFPRKARATPANPSESPRLFWMAASPDVKGSIFADTWACVEMVAVLYVNEPSLADRVLPVFRQWLQLAFTVRQTEKTHDFDHLEGIRKRCDFIINEARALLLASGKAPKATKWKPWEIWVAAGFTVALWLAVLGVTLWLGSDKCASCYIAAIVGTFGAWYQLGTHYWARKKARLAQSQAESNLPAAKSNEPSGSAGHAN